MSDHKTTTFVCSACGKSKATDWPEPQTAMMLAAWALDGGWMPLWGEDKGGRYVRLFCSDPCAEANTTEEGTLRQHPVPPPSLTGS